MRSHLHQTHISSPEGEEEEEEEEEEGRREREELYGTPVTNARTHTLAKMYNTHTHAHTHTHTQTPTHTQKHTQNTYTHTQTHTTTQTHTHKYTHTRNGETHHCSIRSVVQHKWCCYANRWPTKVLHQSGCTQYLCHTSS